jgi:nucleoside-diphosphate-sugar epimerase
MLMESNVTDPVNLGNPEEHTIEEFASIIKGLTSALFCIFDNTTCPARLTDSSSPIVHKEKPVDDPQQRRPDITRADKLLGWKPQAFVAREAQLVNCSL